MTMVRTRVDRGKKDDDKVRMTDLTHGEIGYLAQRDYYVQRVGKGNLAIFVILGSYDKADYYDYASAGHNHVRRLYPGEKVFVEYSK